MKKINVRWKMIGVVALILLVVAVAIFTIISLAAPAEPAQDADTTGASSSVTTVTNGTPGGTSTVSAPSSGDTASIPPTSESTITINLLTPITNNVWVEGQANPIAWDNAADVTGEIDLVDAVTKKFIGVILSETGPKQTSYTWNAEQVYLGRYSPDEIAVEPGVYSISIHFDGNGLGDLVSGPITITK